MQPRIKRYKKYIENEFAASLLWNQDFKLLNFDKNIRCKLTSKDFSKIIFFGMGCSAIVADILKGFIIDQNIKMTLDVINDYQINYSILGSKIQNKNYIFIISSYSGRTPEPILFYKELKEAKSNFICLTSGGKLLSSALRDNIPVIKYCLRNPDFEYPLFHVPQFLSIILKFFYDFDLISSDYFIELQRISKKISNINLRTEFIKLQYIAKRIFKSEIILLADPKWYLILLKLFKMHLNEIAMISAHRNYLHEFTHSEVAILSNPKEKKSILIVKDNENDFLTRKKIISLKKMFNRNIIENKNIFVTEFPIRGNSFLEKFYFSIFRFSLLNLILADMTDTKCRNLIWKSAMYARH